MIIEWVVDAAEAKRCVFRLSANQLSKIRSGIAF
jgi:hypothetical protein